MDPEYMDDHNTTKKKQEHIIQITITIGVAFTDFWPGGWTLKVNIVYGNGTPTVLRES